MVRAPSRELAPVYSHDGKWLYFTSNRTGRPEIWRVPDRGGPAVQITRSGGASPLASHDGSLLYFVRREGSRSFLWSMTLNGGVEERIGEVPFGRVSFAAHRRGLYQIMGATQEAKPVVFRYDPVTRRNRQIIELPGRQSWIASGLSVSPDGQTLLFAGYNIETDLMLVENFH